MDLSKLHLHWRESKYKGKCYISYSLERTYKEDGKNKKEIVVKLGKLNEEELRKWQMALMIAKNPNSIDINDVTFANTYAYLDVAVANEIWDYWELDKAFPNETNKKVNTAVIAKILTINHCIDPTIKPQYWFKQTALPFITKINPSLINSSCIFKELDCIEQYKESICKHICSMLLKHDSEDIKFYDISSTTFLGVKCRFMKCGFCNEEYDDPSVLALIVDKKGRPFYWEVLQKVTKNFTTIEWLLEKLEKKLKIVNPTIVFDHCMISNENLSLLENAKVKYILAIDESQIEEIIEMDFAPFCELNPFNLEDKMDSYTGFSKIDNTYYQEMKTKGNHRYILCFNPQLFNDKKEKRKKALENFQLFIKNINKELLEVKKSRKRDSTFSRFEKELVKRKLNSFVSIELTETNLKEQITTFQVKIYVDNDKMKQVEKMDGFWLLATNHTEKTNDSFTMSPPEAIGLYHDKRIIKSNFKVNLFVNIDPVHTWTENHIKAHYTISVLSNLINKTIDLRLKETHNPKAKEEIITPEKTYKELSKCKISLMLIKNARLKTYKLTQPTKLQLDLLKRLKMVHITQCQKLEKIGVDC